MLERALNEVAPTYPPGDWRYDCFARPRAHAIRSNKSVVSQSAYGISSSRADPLERSFLHFTDGRARIRPQAERVARRSISAYAALIWSVCTRDPSSLKPSYSSLGLMQTQFNSPSVERNRPRRIRHYAAGIPCRQHVGVIGFRKSKQHWGFFSFFA